MRAPGPRSLRANVSWTLASNVVYGIYQWVLIAILAKLSGASAVGAFSLALAIVVPVQMFFNLQLRALQASDAAASFSFATYLVLRLCGMVSTAVIVLSLAATGVIPSEFIAPMTGVLAVKSVESFSDIVYGLFQRMERLDLSSRSRLLESLVGLVVFGIVFYLTKDILVTLLSVAAGLVCILVAVTFPALRRILPAETRIIRQPVEWVQLKGLLWLGLPMGITMALLNLNAALPRFALEHFADTTQVGVFAGFTQLIASGIIVSGALGQSVTPRLSQWFVAGELDRFRGMVNQLLLMGAAMGVVGTLVVLVAGAEIVELIYTAEFATYETSLVIMAFGAIFLFAASIQGYALTAARVLNAQVTIFILVGLATALALVVFVPEHGVMGAAIATVIGSGTQLIAGSVLLGQRLREHRLIADAE